MLSPSDRLQVAQEEMQEYLDNGAQLGGLINRKSKQVEIYRPDREVEVISSVPIRRSIATWIYPKS